MDPSDSQTSQALLTEHFQYTPLSLIDDIIDSVNNYIYQGINSLETGLFSTPPERLGFQKPATTTTTDNLATSNDTDPAKHELEEGLHSLETLLNSTVDKNFDKFEIYVLRNILALPADLVPFVRLRHYDGIPYPLSSSSSSTSTTHNGEQETGVPSAERIEKLRKEVFAARRVGRHLSSEITRNEAVLAQLRGMLAVDPSANTTTSTDANTSASANTNINTTMTATPTLAFLTPKTTTTTTRPLTSHTQFTLSQLPTLRSSLADLRAKLDGLRAGNVSALGETARDEAREERRGYIETRTRVVLGVNGEEVGSGSGSGKARGEEEVEALESVMRSLKREA